MQGIKGDIYTLESTQIQLLCVWLTKTHDVKIADFEECMRYVLTISIEAS